MATRKQRRKQRKAKQRQRRQQRKAAQQERRRLRLAEQSGQWAEQADRETEALARWWAARTGYDTSPGSPADADWSVILDEIDASDPHLSAELAAQIVMETGNEEALAEALAKDPDCLDAHVVTLEWREEDGGPITRPDVHRLQERLLRVSSRPEQQARLAAVAAGEQPPELAGPFRRTLEFLLIHHRVVANREDKLDWAASLARIDPHAAAFWRPAQLAWRLHDGRSEAAIALASGPEPEIPDLAWHAAVALERCLAGDPVAAAERCARAEALELGWMAFLLEQGLELAGDSQPQPDEELEMSVDQALIDALAAAWAAHPEALAWLRAHLPPDEDDETA